MNDTIFAPATAPGRAAIAIVRLSGPGSAETLSSLTTRDLPPPRQAALRRLYDGSGELIDEGMVLWMPAPASFTGEDCAELHLHGGPAVLAAMLDRLGDLGLRLAEAGEFTRRAFQNGRLDLSQAEAVGDLVAAETPGQRRQALAQMEGALTRRYESWRQALLDVMALLEAQIDFPEEDDVPAEVGAPVAASISQVMEQMHSAAGEIRGERVREGYRVALVGPPNVGKSSLLNVLTGREAAIVTEIAGTTRDVVEAPLVICGQSVTLADTAGLRQTDDLIEAEGVRRARAWSEAADLRVGIADATRPETFAEAVEPLRPGDIVVINKSDLVDRLAPCPAPPGMTGVSSDASPEGVAGLMEVLAQRVGALGAGDEFPAVTRARHRTLLAEAIQHLERALDDRASAVELAGEGVRLALRSLERVTGRSAPEAVLDRVFASFCIGK